MSNVILKYRALIAYDMPILSPGGRIVRWLSAAIQEPELPKLVTLWAEVEEEPQDAPGSAPDVTVLGRFTGAPLLGNEGAHIATVTSGGHTWHLFSPRDPEYHFVDPYRPSDSFRPTGFHKP
ncbi:hypothetical protein SEA_PUPPER_188 [Gordonia phage Pupper]|uniref:DUF7352 domain-containing protein n=1 Tax=Gordonia phage Pupper TaxID=2571249 RepID=A0A4Y6ETN0_9CAUD|nr:hypothetical protein KHQ83_gp089 [Gordonia phage Pupper]QDF18674.1 hypothetical protein SEA_PUPPER_188 [Gordonia phage Pupper]QDF18906.1 hypothetical protein SEA_SCENTAE_187 [Gordonia phage SCentae]